LTVTGLQLRIAKYRKGEKREARRSYEQTVGEASREVPGEIPNGEVGP
jgi:hypothetical protein